MEASLLPQVEEALAILRPHVETSENGIFRENARAISIEEGAYDEEDAVWLLALLEDRGYIYEVKGRLRITPK